MTSFFLASILLLSPSSLARVTGDVVAYCNSLDPATTSEANDCLKFSQMCNFQMYGIMNSACGASGDHEQNINRHYSQIQNLISNNESYNDNANSGVESCKTVASLRDTQKLTCSQLIELCETGKNPAPSINGQPEVFMATVKSKTRGVVKVTCDSYPKSVCKVGRQDLEGRLPTVTATETQQCESISQIANATENEPAREPSDEGGSPDYTAEEIICHFNPSAEGCP